MKQKRYKYTKQGAKEVSLKIKLIERKKEIVIAIIVIMAITIFALINKYKSKEVIEEEVSDIGIVDVSQYKSLQQLLISYGCVYYNDETIDGKYIITVKFKHSLYERGESKEEFYMGLLAAIAEFKEYISFNINDNEREINIEVKCANKEIKEIIINGDSNYFENKDSQNALLKREKLYSTFEITSGEINSLINNNWSNSVNLGTKDSYFDKYHFYFDEGIKARIICRRVYNIIFTNNYKKTIVNNITVNSTEDEIRASLGEPNFVSEDGKLIGYLNDKIYVFFDKRNDEVSIYRVENYDSTDFINLVNKYNNGMSLKEFGNELTYVWDDYDSYHYNEEGMEILYSLRGVKISFYNNNRMRKLKNGINLYNNYYGKVSKDILITDIKDISQEVEKNIYFNSIDLVFESEDKRSSIYKKLRDMNNENLDMQEFVAITESDYGTTFDYSYRETKEETITEEIDNMWDLITQSNTDNVEKKNENDKFPTHGLKFVSKNPNFPDVEIREDMVISSFLWYNKYRIVFSVDFDGIYTFDCITQKKTKILENTGIEIDLKMIVDNEVIYNNNEKIALELE